MQPFCFIAGDIDMLTNVYISVSDEQKHLIVDGSLELLRQLLSVLRKSEDSQGRGLTPTDADQQAQEVSQ